LYCDFHSVSIHIHFTDPYLASIYPVYSLLAGMSTPYVDSELEAPKNVSFLIDVDFIPEGENDHVQVVKTFSNV